MNTKSLTVPVLYFSRASFTTYTVAFPATPTRARSVAVCAQRASVRSLHSRSALDNVDPVGDPSCNALEKFVKDALKRDYDTATLHSLTQGHGDGGQPEESWEGLLDFTLVSS